VRECLEFQAKLRVPTNQAVGQPQSEGAAAGISRVEAVLKRMKLKKQEHTMVGNTYQRGLSGLE